MAMLGGAAGADAATGPLYDVKATWGDTHLPPGGDGVFRIQLRNIGDAESAEALTLVDELPAGVTATSLSWSVLEGFDFSSFCSGLGTGTVTCVIPGPYVEYFLPPPGSGGGGLSAEPSGYVGPLLIQVAVDPAATGIGTNRTAVSGGGAPPVEDVDGVPIDPTPSGFGFVPGSFEADVFDAEFPFGGPSRQAGDHPFEQRVNFDLNGALDVNRTPRDITSHHLVKTVEVTLPRGMVGNPEATPKCDPTDFAEIGSTKNSTGCPADTQVGYATVPVHPYADGVTGNGVVSRIPIYNLVPPPGVAADFGFNAFVVQAHIYPELDPAQGYAIKTVSPFISSFETVRSAEVTVWGVPGDSAHDKFRAYPRVTAGKSLGAPWGSASIRPLLTNPTDCGFENGGARIRAESYAKPGEFTPVEEWPHPLNVTGCDDPRFRFEPELALQPDNPHAGAPTGLDIHLEIPQRSDAVETASELYAKNGDVQGIATPPLKKAVVTLPEGMTISPSAAQGLGSCTPAEIGLATNAPIHCPENSQLGTLILHTPILPPDNPPRGFVYVAKQGDNPFHNFLSIYLAIEEPERGILVKIPGRIDLDPNTGQITTTFDDLPQFPVSDMQMTLKGGARAALVNPATCGAKTVTAEFFSWQAPDVPTVVTDSYDISDNPDGSPCPNSLGDRRFKPSLEAGTLNPTGGAFSSFVFRLTRSDDDQEFSRLNVTLPPGLAARLAGVSECSDAAIAAAEAPGRTGTEEQSNPSCPSSSQIGHTSVGAGAGASLTYVPGNAYLAGPYKGAPLSMVVISPTVVGPYDLGVIAVRSALNVDPTTTQVSISSDPLPQIFKGIPVRIRDIRVNADRPKFTINPTSCAEKQITAHVTGTGGDVLSSSDDTAVDLEHHFQAASCASLGFKPRLGFRLSGGVRRAAHPKLKATLRARPGDANIARASVLLPHSEFLDQAHIRTVCTRVQFAAGNCPAGAIYGRAEAVSPLLDRPLKGPVYLRSSNNPLPDLVADLNGQIHVVLVGRIDSTNGRIRNTFDFVPDAPVTRFTLEMRGGKRGLLINSTNLCAKRHRAVVRFGGQNGKKSTLTPVLKNSCKKNQNRKHRGRAR
jgi:hypothetical protein